MKHQCGMCSAEVERVWPVDHLLVCDTCREIQEVISRQLEESRSR
jgi:hypothetical protein